MANANKFHWFDTKPQLTQTPEGGFDKYIPSQRGALSAIGQALSGVSAPYLGDMDYALKQSKLDQQRNEADMEFQKYILKHKADTQLYNMLLGSMTTPTASGEPTDSDLSFNPSTPDVLPGIPDISAGLTSSTPGGIPLQLLGGYGGKPRFGLDPVSLAVRKAVGGQQQKDQLEANKAVSRDTAIYGMMEGVMKDLNNLYGGAEKAGYTGDIYRAGLGNLAATGKLPKEITSKMSQKGIENVAEFTARRNEIMTRMQPLLSEQFGKEGSNRIMESLLKLTEKEVGQLSDPKVAFIGKSVGTLKNFYRFAKASSDYAKKLGITNQALSSMSSEEIDKFVSKALQSEAGKFSKDDNEYFQRLEKDFYFTSVPEGMKKSYNAFRNKGLSDAEARKKAGF